MVNMRSCDTVVAPKNASFFNIDAVLTFVRQVDVVLILFVKLLS